MWYDGQNTLYAAWRDELFYINASGTETSIGALTSATLTYLTALSSTANLTTYTYAATALGTAHANRRIIVAVMFDASDDYAAVSVTVGGVAATLVVGANAFGIGGDGAVALYIALVPTGTTGDIVVQYATAALRSAVGVWRLDGAFSSTAVDTATDTVTSFPGASISVPSGGVIVAALYEAATTAVTWTSPLTERFDSAIESAKRFSGADYSSTIAQEVLVASPDADGTGLGGVAMAAASWAGNPILTDVVTFAKNNNSPTPDQVLCTPNLGAFTFTTSAITVLNVNSEVPNSVCFGEGYFFFTTPGGLCYASGSNTTTVSALDVTRAEQRAEALLRGKFWNGQLFLFGQSHIEVFASGGNPNATGFPLNFVTAIWRGLIAPLAVCGDEEGFEGGGLFFVADDNSVRMLQGYDPVTISTPVIERAIEACTDKSSIRMFCYDVDGHACVVVDLAGEGTWVYDVMEGGLWHERDTNEQGYWRATGNSVKAFGKWLVGDHDSGNIYQIDKDSLTDGGTAMPFIVESIAMESFPQRLLNSRADFNFVTGVGTTTVDDPEVLISWSDDGGHTWSDPVTRKLGEAGRYFDQVRVNRLGLTGRKGRRFRLRVDDEVYVGLIGGNGEFAGRP